MSFYKLEVTKELFVDIYVEVDDSVPKHSVPAIVRDRLTEIIKETVYDNWEEELPHVSCATPCGEEEAEKWGVFRLTTVG